MIAKLAFIGWLGLVLLSFTPVCATPQQAQAGSPKSAQPQAASTQNRTNQGIELFEKQIRPVLIDKCYSCHSKSAETIEGGLELDSPVGLARGGDSGPAIIKPDISSLMIPDQGDIPDRGQQNLAERPGPESQAATSLLLRVLRHEEGLPSMPPDEKLPEEVIGAFQQWIQLGAPDPRASTGTSAAQLRFEQRQRHWAFQPPQAIPPPVVEQTDWPRSPIDVLILARLESEGLRPVRDANRITLVRRLYFDLIGLPPTPEQVREVIEDAAPDAVATLVDRLLDSSRFGERWARHWLDVVRFAESSGKEFNFTYPHAWPYRNYVIDSLNQDKPYDQFVIEQIAGDLLPDAPYESATDREARLIAPGMLACGPKRHNSGGMDFRMGIVDDQIDVTCRAILGLTVACAKCHDHKFDPVPTKDYYALAGIFLSTEALYGTIKQKYSNNPTDLLPIGPNATALHAAATAHEKKIAAAEKPWTAKQEELNKALAAAKTATEQKKRAEKRRPQSAGTAAPITQPSSDQTPGQLLATASATLDAANAQVEKLKAELAPLKATVEELKNKRPPRPAYAMSARDRAKPADTKIAIRGDFSKPGNLVPRGFLSALKVTGVPTIDPAHSGRLELARWLTSRHNPLTARVMVNRIWHHLFGRGLVESVDNFGVMGKKPSHPELLDTLAVQFIREGWSVKRMIRTIVMSRTYQLSCQVDEAGIRSDPAGRLLWRSVPRRLSVEAIRDAILAVSGQLEVDPPQGSPVTGLGDQMVRGVDPGKLQPASRHRSVYLPVVRDYLPDLFDQFDFPSPSLVSGQRTETNVPDQALYLRNSPFVAEQSLQAARRLLASQEAPVEGAKTKVDDGILIDRAMRWALARPATEAERQAALALVRPILSAEPQIENGAKVAWAAWFRALFASAEFRYLVDIETPTATAPQTARLSALRTVSRPEESP